jgi:hypothetical protein
MDFSPITFLLRYESYLIKKGVKIIKKSILSAPRSFQLRIHYCNAYHIDDFSNGTAHLQNVITMIHEMTSKTQLANQFQIPSRTLCRWIQEICDAVEPPQASVFGVAQGMVPIPEYPLAPTVYRWRQNKSMKDADPSQCDVRCGTAGGCFPCASIPPVCGAI